MAAFRSSLTMPPSGNEPFTLPVFYHPVDHGRAECFSGFRTQLLERKFLYTFRFTGDKRTVIDGIILRSESHVVLPQTEVFLYLHKGSRLYLLFLCFFLAISYLKCRDSSSLIACASCSKLARISSRTLLNSVMISSGVPVNASGSSKPICSLCLTSPLKSGQVSRAPPQTVMT